MVVSGLDAIDAAGDGAGDALVFFDGLSPEDGELIVDRLWRIFISVNVVEHMNALVLTKDSGS